MSYLITTPYIIKDIKPLKEAGADGVVIGTPFFSARAAAIFSFDELKLLRKETKQLNLLMFVLVNRMFTEEELDRLTDYLKYLKELQVDGIYFCDEGVLQIAESLHMADRLIYQPDTLLTNSCDVKFYLDEGLKMVTLAKEITLAEMCAIAKHADGSRIEVIIHGRENMMHSKRRLLSSYMEHIHAADTVFGKRTLYLREETRDDHFPILEDELGTHVFTGFTLAAFAEIKTLADAGIAYFRIDGIFHDLAYVCEALRLYRAVLSNQADGAEVFADYKKRYADDHVTTGFLYQRTGLHKERL